MAQFGTLSAGNQTIFLSRQAGRVREPTFVCWVAGIGDTTNYIMDIDSEVRIESPRGRGYLNIGRAVIKASNKDDTFYSGGVSQIQANASIKVWAGFGGLNIPIFTGVVRSVEPIPESDNVILSCTDLMGLFRELRVSGSQGSNNTIKLILENFCSDISAADNMPSTNETTETLNQPTFEPQAMLSATEEACDCLFSVGLFDENGTFQFYEREHRNYVDWTFDDDNVLEDGVKVLAPTEIVNSVDVEYRENYIARYENQTSIDSYRKRGRRLRVLLLNSTEIASKTTGSTAETIDNNYEGFKFTSAASIANVDSVAVWMKQSSASGNMALRIYDDSGGDPNTLLATSEILQAGDLSSLGFAKVFFTFTSPVEISPSTDYWGIIDASGVSGTIYFRISAATASAKHAYSADASSWTTENDKQAMFIAHQSLQAQRVAEDLVRFHKDPHERLRIVAPAVPHLQRFDDVLVDISQPFTIKGRYVIERRSHKLGSDERGQLVYKTVDVLRKTG